MRLQGSSGVAEAGCPGTTREPSAAPPCADLVVCGRRRLPTLEQPHVLKRLALVPPAAAVMLRVGIARSPARVVPAAVPVRRFVVAESPIPLEVLP